MQTLRFLVTKAVWALLPVALMIACFSSCKDETEGVKSSETVMSDVVVVAAGTTFSTMLSDTTFYFVVETQFEELYSHVFSSARVDFTLSAGATSEPKSGETVNLSENVVYTVTAEDGSVARYIVSKIVGSWSDAALLSFKLIVGANELVGDIDESELTITFFPTHTMWNQMLTATPVFELSPGATIDLKSEPMDFTQTFTFSVTSRDETTAFEWTVVVLDPCIFDPIPTCAGFSDPDPVLENTINLGNMNTTANYAVSSTVQKIDDGIWYMRAQVTNSEHPLIMHTVRYTTSYYQDYSIETWVANDSIRGKLSPGAMVTRYANATPSRNARLAINGGFYGMAADGTPISMQQKNGIVTYPPAGELPMIGFDDRNRPYMGNVTLNSKVVRESNGGERVINSVNGMRLENALVLYNSYAGRRTRTNEWGAEVLLSPVDGDWETLDSHINVRCRVETIQGSGTRPAGSSMIIPKGKIVLSGHGTGNTFLTSLQVGDYVSVTVDFFLNSEPNVTSTTIRNIVSGWNIVLRNNEILPYRTSDALESGREPRTAVGFTNDKKYLFFTIVEGRNPTTTNQTVSRGVSTQTLARVMQYFGAENAINLDGGGSSCMILEKEKKNYTDVNNYQRNVADGLAIIRR